MEFTVIIISLSVNLYYNYNVERRLQNIITSTWLSHKFNFFLKE